MPTHTTLPGPAPRATRVVGVLVALLVALTGLVAIAQPAAAAGATVTGRLVTPDGKPVDAMEMTVRDGGSPVAEAITGADGTFTITGVPAGTYNLDAFDPFDTYLGIVPKVTLADGQTRALGDIKLIPLNFPHTNAKLTGHVYDPAGKPARGVQVTARNAVLQSDNQVYGYGVTNRNGQFWMDPDELGSPPPQPGTWKLAYVGVARALPPETFLYGFRFSGNQPTWARATTVTIDSTLHTAPDATVVLNGGVSGTFTSTVPMTASNVTVYDVDGEQVTTKATGAGGAYSIETLRPGSYYLRFSSPDGGGGKFIRTFWPGAASIADATKVVVKTGQFTTPVNQQISDQLTAFRKPTISGSPKVGSTLTASPGTWSLAAVTEYSYEWLRSGVDVVGTAKTYKPVAADAGKKLSVRVTAKSLDKSGAATSASTATVKRVSTVSAKASYSRSKKRLTLTVRVTVPGLSSPGGTVTVKEGSRTIKARVTVRSGKAVIFVSKPKKGRHTYKLAYSGTTTVLSDTGSVSARIR